MGNLVDQVNTQYKSLIAAAKATVDSNRVALDSALANTANIKSQLDAQILQRTQAIGLMNTFAVGSLNYTNYYKMVKTLESTIGPLQDQYNQLANDLQNKQKAYDDSVKAYNDLTVNYNKAILEAQTAENTAASVVAANATQTAIAADPSLLAAQIKADADLKQKALDAATAQASTAANVSAAAAKNKNMILGVIAVVVVIGLVFVAIKVLK